MLVTSCQQNWSHKATNQKGNCFVRVRDLSSPVRQDDINQTTIWEIIATPTEVIPNGGEK